jgi:hypothetical protein
MNYLLVNDEPFPREFILVKEHHTIPIGTHYVIEPAAAYHSVVKMKNGKEFECNITHKVLLEFTVKPCTVEQFLKFKLFI